MAVSAGYISLENVVIAVDKALGDLDPGVSDTRPAPDVRTILLDVMGHLSGVPRAFLGLMATTAPNVASAPGRNEIVGRLQGLVEDLNRTTNWINIYLATLGSASPHKLVRIDVPYLMIKGVRDKVVDLYLKLRPEVDPVQLSPPAPTAAPHAAVLLAKEASPPVAAAATAPTAPPVHETSTPLLVVPAEASRGPRIAPFAPPGAPEGLVHAPVVIMPSPPNLRVIPQPPLWLLLGLDPPPAPTPPRPAAPARPAAAPAPTAAPAPDKKRKKERRSPSGEAEADH